MLVAHIDELIGYDVVAIMCGSWRSHSIAVDVKDARGDGEEGQKLQVSFVLQKRTFSIRIFRSYNGKQSDQHGTLLYIDVLIVFKQRSLVPRNPDGSRGSGHLGV